MFDSELFESLWPTPKPIDTTAWLMLGILVAALCLALKLPNRPYVARFPLLFLSLLTLGLPGIPRLIIDSGRGSDSSFLWMFEMFPGLVTNSLIIAAVGELLIARLDLLRAVRITFDVVMLCSIPCGLSIFARLEPQQFPTLLESSLTSALALLVLSAIWITMGSRNDRKANSEGRLIPGAMAGIFVSANLMSLVPSARFTAAQIE